MKKALEHTGEPDEGDYINFQYASYEGSAETTVADGAPAVKIEYKLSYYDSLDQEAEVDRKVKEIMKELDLDDMTDYEKTVAIYDYLCDNTEYEAAEDGDDIRRTAYGALVQKKAVCQGYSLALYRLLLAAGVDNRIIFGTGIDPGGSDGAHTWNIVNLYGKYYYIDATWDDSTGSRKHFLQPAGSGFEDTHIPDDEYEDDFFTTQYPLADTEFNGEIREVSKTIIWCVEHLEKAILNKANTEADRIM
jgi:transglutaminase-like putative cysteine protease